MKKLMSLVATVSAVLLAVGCDATMSSSPPPPPATAATPAVEKVAEAAPPAQPQEPATEVAAAEPRDTASLPAAKSDYDPTAHAYKLISELKVGKQDWPQWFGSPLKNNTPEGKNIPFTWNAETGENFKWTAPLGSQTYGNPVIANGKVYVGTNNGAGYLKRYPSRVDLGVLVAFNEADGKFLWQHSSEKLPTGRVHDWPLQGICSTPLIDGERMWYVTSRTEVVCLDTEGFHDGENDGDFKTEKPDKPDVVWEEEKEADVIWKLDMMKQLGTQPHNMCSGSVTAAGDYLFVNTSNGVDEAHINIPTPDAPSFLCLDKNTGKVLWSDKSPGNNILHGQWSSPAYGEFNGHAQVLFTGGDGWLYSFDPKGDDGKAKLLWKFDCNPKDSFYALQRATRNHLIGTPTIYDGLVYIGVGEDPEHGEGDGHLWCINPVNKGGDVSPTIVYNKADPNTPIPHKRIKALEEDLGDFEKDNPNSAAVWHYMGKNPESDEFTDVFHRTVGSCAIKDDVLYIADFSGCFHCLDAKTGKVHWVFDMLAASWGSPLIVDGKVYIGDEDGDIHIFEHSTKMKALESADGPARMKSSVYTTPVVANNTLFISDKDTLYAIVQGAKSEPPKSRTFEASDSE